MRLFRVCSRPKPWVDRTQEVTVFCQRLAIITRAICFLLVPQFDIDEGPWHVPHLDLGAIQKLLGIKVWLGTV